MSKITVLPNNKTIEYVPGKSLLDILRKKDFLTESPCGGKGICGKCKIHVLKGKLPPVTDTEKIFLSSMEQDDGYRLACIVYPEEDITISLDEVKKNYKILSSGYMPDFEMNPVIRKIFFVLERPEIGKHTSYEDIFLNDANASCIEYNTLKCLPSKPGEYTLVLSEDKIIAVENGDTRDKLYGISVDIGTTTIVASITDMNTGQEIAAESIINTQKQYGLDVITRITYAIENPDDGVKNLQNNITNTLSKMIDKLCLKAGIRKKYIYEIAVAANNTMLHLLLGVAPCSIGCSPFIPAFNGSKYIKAFMTGLRLPEYTMMYCLPSVSSYIGADIVAGIYVSKIYEKSGNILFIDIGTNGEIVFSSGGKMISCSCAAGPALEGMNISSGMRAAEGAIEELHIGQGKINLKVIGDKEPEGICGSGIMAALRELINIGFIKKNGSICKEKDLSKDQLPMLWQEGKSRGIILYSNGENKIVITQKDIRQIQLAKGAILSGFFALLNQAGISMEELDEILIAGQFGSHLSAESLIGSGILPEGTENKITYIGNTSKTGAHVALLSANARAEMENLAKNIDYMELSAMENYEKLFVKCLEFPLQHVTRH
mgnify:FL=1